MAPFINTFSNYYTAKYGAPVGKITLDAGRTCPNREKGGCIYCSAESFTPFYLEKNDSVATQLEKGKAFLHKRKFTKFFSYFQQETTTAAPLAELLAQLRSSVSDPDCIGLIISTRPDYIKEEFLTEFATFAADNKEILIELGLQSAHEKTLRFLNRNHTFEDFVNAVGKIRKAAANKIGVHLILGLPDETFADMLKTVQAVCNLGIDYIKFHHLQVIRDTPLERLYSNRPFTIYSPAEYLETLARLLAQVPRHIVLHRLWSTAAPKLLVAPQWKMSAYELNALLMKIMKEQDLYQGKYIHHE